MIKWQKGNDNVDMAGSIIWASVAVFSIARGEYYLAATQIAVAMFAGLSWFKSGIIRDYKKMNDEYREMTDDLIATNTELLSRIAWYEKQHGPVSEGKYEQ